MHQFCEVRPGQRGEQPDDRVFDIRQIGVMRRELPAAFLADRPGDIQQRVEEAYLEFKALRQQQIRQYIPPGKPGRLIFLTTAAPEELQEQRRWKRRDWLVRGALACCNQSADPLRAERLFQRIPRGAVSRRGKWRWRSFSAQNQLHADGIILAEHIRPSHYQKNAVRPCARNSASMKK